MAYRRLLDLYYDSEAYIPLETQSVARRLQVGFDALTNVLNEFFIKTEHGYQNLRADAVIAEYHVTCERNRANGKLGGRPKKTQSVSSRLPVGCQSEPTGKPTINHKPETINQEPLKTKPISPPVGEDVMAVFFHWQRVMSKDRSKLDEKRKKAIKARLKDGYSVDDLKQAIEGCKNSPYHMGDNDRKTMFNDLELICRDGSKVDAFMSKAKPKEDESWWRNAGFGHRDEARNFDCTPANAHLFRNGRRIAA